MRRIRYRGHRPDDLPTLVRLIRTELMPMSHTVSPDDPVVLAGLPERFDSGRTIVAAPEVGSPIGFVHFGEIHGLLHIDMLVVDPLSRGTGIGLELMRRAEREGTLHGSLMAVLFVDDVNEKARRFYAREGYEPVRHFPDLKVTQWTKSLQPSGQ
ncbi:GNAT family N-acetyltransferase [Paenibacillus albicereus]|uniref:GNAT family N-acetyltransferase n=1 Tax=Paenibacillus albicereus TaxID=2726185 RepID=A0A6H2GV88_9BACL|nr:GNAT family N-acetyltransferase [Paenibacillus albicereus]QJC51302.1 GNAT family N-acetyltransferase [Paenibacillus albicereus]